MIALLLSALLAVANVSDDVRPPNPRPPNIVLIVADDLGWGHLGSYGQELIATPNLDRLAEQGLRFTAAYAGAPVCAPSRCVLMTGRHAGHASVRSNVGDVHLQRDDVTLAEILSAAGWTTGMFGKWGLGVAGSPGVPSKQGFDEFFGFLHQVHAQYYYPTYLWEDGRRHDLIGNDGGPQGQSGAGRSQYAPDRNIGRALAFIRTHRDEPFFCYVPTILPHVELLVPDESMEPYLGVFEETPYPGNGRHAAQPNPRAAFAGMVSHLDTNVGLLLVFIDELELAEDTIVIFTSDNGPEQGAGTDPDFFAAAGPFRGHKRDLYEGGLRVPLIVRWEGHIAPGTTSDLVVTFADVLPTVAALVGVAAADLPPDLDGLSIAPTLTGTGEQPVHDDLYWEYARVDWSTRSFQPDRLSQALRSGRWKLVRNDPDGPLELFDLAADPGETTDVAADHADVVQRLSKQMAAARTEPREQVRIPPPAGKDYD